MAPEAGGWPRSGAHGGYAVPADLKSWLRMRDERCRFPGCAPDASRCDLDHVIDWAAGGPTDQDNLIHLCRRHHRLRHTTGWDAEIVTRPLSPDGVGGASANGSDRLRAPDGPGAPDWAGGPPETDECQRPVGASVRWPAPSGRQYTTHDALHDRHDPDQGLRGPDRPDALPCTSSIFPDIPPF